MDQQHLNKIKIIVPFYNPGSYLEMCIHSVLTQKYDNYEVLWIDDASTDDSFSKLPDCKFETDESGNPKRDDKGDLIITEKHPLFEITKCSNVVAWKASSRACMLANIHNAIMTFCSDPEDIVFVLSGDDWLIGNSVLAYINDFFNTNDCWFMYGSSRTTDDNKKCRSGAYMQSNFDNIRAAEFRVSNPMCFRAGLYHRIADTDPTFKCFQNASGEYFRMATDMALSFPLMELAGYDKVKYNDKVVHQFNTENKLAIKRMVTYSELENTQKEIMEKPQFKKIENYRNETADKISDKRTS